MTATLVAGRTRLQAGLGRLSMYRLMLLALTTLVVIAFAVSFGGQLVTGPWALAATATVLLVACLGTDVAAQRLLRLPGRLESSAITALILVFVVRPTLTPLGLLGIVLAGVAASASKYLLAWRGRHLFNPAAVGATVLLLSGLGTSAWWVGTPLLLVPVLLLGVAVLWRTEKLGLAALFWLVATVVSFVRTVVQAQLAGLTLDFRTVAVQLLTASPFLFLGAFMLSEPLTLPPRRRQQLLVALVVGVLAGWPIGLGIITLGQERALLVGNLLAFLLARRAAVRLELKRRTELGPTATELTFEAPRGLAFEAGQYLELSVPHRRPDARGTRREFSIVSAPADLPELRIAYRNGATARSSYKHALARAHPGRSLSVTGVWGDFVLPADAAAPVLMVAAGIGITPFVSQLRQARASARGRDIVLVYVTSDAELLYRDEIEAAGVPVVVFTRAEPANLPAGWLWAGEVRLDAESLRRTVPDVERRHAYVSGAPGLIAELAPALGTARSLTTDAFSGY